MHKYFVCSPKKLQDFETYPNVLINYKNQDFTIFKILKCTFDCNGQREEREIIVPAVAIECKTYIPSTMLGQSIYEAQLLKQGNPYSNSERIY
ncbi:MAG: Bpu10I family restriction endonuclease [Planctomycetaceae bacterium]|nr:Bpu10I family restriction endonuclease [Planctomycetaceae bacterium]